MIPDSENSWNSSYFLEKTKRAIDFNFDFYDSSEQKIKEQQITTLNENGKEIIIIDNKEISSGEGYSKKESEQDAAKIALKQMEKSNE